MRIFLRCFSVFLVLFVCRVASGHAPPIYLPTAPIRVQGAALVDATGTRVLLRGVQMPGAFEDTLNPISFRLIKQRWNANTVRLPVSLPRWRAEGSAFLDRVTTVTRAARNEGLVVVLVPFDPDGSGMPPLDVTAFWIDCATRFLDDNGVVFSLFQEPAGAAIPGFVEGVHRPADWEFWRNGGLLADGTTQVSGMQALVDAIRGTGAQHVISAPAFHDVLEFQGFGPDFYLRDANVIYESNPYFDAGLSDERREANFGFLRTTFPLYAGSWGTPLGRGTAACRAIPPDPLDASALLFQTLSWFDFNDVSWTAADFTPGSLIQDTSEFTPTELNAWNCDGGEVNLQGPGIGTTILLWTTGDPLGFGSILPEFIANLAGGPAAPVAPGELIGLYGQGLGPDQDKGSESGVRLYFNDIPAPIMFANSYQVYAQVPYEMAGQREAAVHLYYNDVPSNRIRLVIVPAAPELFVARGSLTDAQARNEDGAANGSLSAAPRASTVIVTASGVGELSGDGSPVLPVSVTFGGRSAQVLSARPTGSQIGMLEIEVRIPADLPLTSIVQRVETILTVGSYSSRSGVFIWVR